LKSGMTIKKLKGNYAFDEWGQKEPEAKDDYVI
jgi:hypothetical protein